MTTSLRALLTGFAAGLLAAVILHSFSFLDYDLAGLAGVLAGGSALWSLLFPTK